MQINHYSTTPEDKAKQFIKETISFSGEASQYFNKAQGRLYNSYTKQNKIKFWNIIENQVIWSIEQTKSPVDPRIIPRSAFRLQDYYERLLILVKEEINSLES